MVRPHDKREPAPPRRMGTVLNHVAIHEIGALDGPRMVPRGMRRLAHGGGGTVALVGAHEASAGPRDLTDSGTGRLRFPSMRLGIAHPPRLGHVAVVYTPFYEFFSVNVFLFS